MFYVNVVSMAAVFAAPFLLVRTWEEPLLAGLVSFLLWLSLCLIGIGFRRRSRTYSVVEVLAVQSDNEFSDALLLETHDGHKIEIVRIPSSNLALVTAELPTDKLVAEVREVVESPCSWWPTVFPCPLGRIVLWNYARASIKGSQLALNRIPTKR